MSAAFCFELETVRQSDSECFVAVRGEVDIATGPQLYEQLAMIAEDGAKSVVLDLSGMTFIDARGIAAISKAVKGLGLKLTLRHPSSLAGHLFELVGLDKVCAIDADDSAARVTDGRVASRPEAWRLQPNNSHLIKRPLG
ncbi:MAG: STAS domain-containing protein [Acidimicrobiales bacterium]